MSKINEIIESGCAPGFRTGSVDPDSVYAKAPKGLREIENEPLFKHGPARGASRIGKYFGMSPSSIKKVWEKPIPVALAMILFCITSMAGDITPGETFTDGQTIHASDLNTAIGGSTINSVAITRLPFVAPSLADQVFANSTISGYNYRLTLAKILSLPNILALTQPVYTNADYFNFYSVSASNMVSVTFSNLVLTIASNINPVSYLQFSPTNSASGGSNVPVLANWSGAFTGSSTNNQPYSIWWGLNGIPYQQSLSNLESGLANDLGTNFMVAQMFNFAFQPWTFYGTNTTTNVWGYYTNFPITSLYLTNAANPTNSTLTLLSSDTLPIYAGGQKTNTTVTIGAINQYVTNANSSLFALPAYTQARIQFGGFHVTYAISNAADNVNGLIRTVNTATNFSSNTIYCVSFTTNNINANIVTNQAYFIVTQPTNQTTFHVYSNYTAAVNGTNWMGVSGSTIGNGISLFYLTNYTSYNADVYQISSGNTGANNGLYGIYFRTNSANSNYYVTATPSITSGGYWPICSVATDFGNPTNTGFVFGSHNSGGSGYGEAPKFYILVNPQ